MSCKTLVQNVSNHGLETYEGSYSDIFSVLDYKFLPFQVTLPTKRRGRPAFPKEALFKACLLRFLMPDGSFRMVEAHLKQNQELAEILGFFDDNVPSDSVLKMYFKNLTITKLRQFYKDLIMDLLAENVIDPSILALDSALLEVRWKQKSKKNPNPFDPDARRGFAKSKGGFYFGYKAHALTDTKSGLPIMGTITPANVSDQKTMGTFINFIKELGLSPEKLLADKGYDSKKNHRILREKLGAIGFIPLNSRRGKKKKSKKKRKKRWNKHVQLTLDKFIPIEIREKKYRKQCAGILETIEGKKIMAKRTTIERTFSFLKENLKLENIPFSGLKQVVKHFLMKCIVMLVTALTAVKIGAHEAIRSVRYFQR